MRSAAITRSFQGSARVYRRAVNGRAAAAATRTPKRCQGSANRSHAAKAVAITRAPSSAPNPARATPPTHAAVESRQHVKTGEGQPGFGKRFDGFGHLWTPVEPSHGLGDGVRQTQPQSPPIQPRPSLPRSVRWVAFHIVTELINNRMVKDPRCPAAPACLAATNLAHQVASEWQRGRSPWTQR